MANILIFGGSRGLGTAFSQGLPVAGDRLWLVSRSQPESLGENDAVNRIWVKADLRCPVEAAATVAEALSTNSVDVLIYNAGIWEQQAFDSAYRFENVRDEETIDIIAVNLTSAIVCVQRLLPNLRRSTNAKVVLIGSASGLENTGSSEVAYTASKFGLRGLGYALRETLRPDGIAVTCINPGEIAATIPYADGIAKAIAAYGGRRIPVHDLVMVVKCLMNLSKVACIKEIDILAITERNA